MPSDPNLKAAQVVVLHAYASNEASLEMLAEKRYPGSKHTTIGRIAKKLEAANTLDINEVPDRRIRRPRLLTDEEDEAIVAFVVWMQRSGLPASKYEVEDAALMLCRRRDPNAKH
ncbi:hypothetical protein FOCG_17790 [Fusarium oxysporum f. sp. radicis-lycopersici 26381]|nr:hypothetical protein FOCG_17790 [Fusarium oxysporum f. sp. radicis-lycopersici 26381]